MNDGNNSGGSGDTGGGSGVPMSGPQSSPAAGGSPVLVMPQTDRGTQQLLLLGGLGMGCFGMVMMLLAVGLIVWAVTRSPGGGPVLADREDQRQVVSNAPAESLDPKVGSPAVDEGAADAAIPSQHTEAVATSVGPASPPPVEEADLVDRSVSPERPPEEPIVSAVELDSPPAEISVPKPNGPRPVYEFAAGDEFTYTFNVVADLGPAISKVSGECSYEVLDNAVQPPLEDPGSGTGFVVAENGYLITCAHVVTDSRHVTVTVDGKQYDGRVVGVDPEQDLALLKIPASGLQPLPLADSEKVRSAQDVHAVGYPLSDLLGNAIKVTRGTVAGVLDDVARKRFHIDAAINPGNSGGPIFDNRGGVIGIASAKLSGVDVSRVGFAIPSNAARSLLDKHRISPAAMREEASLTGPELVERVTPSVALIEVSVDPDRYQLFRLKYSGKMDYDAEKKDGSFTTIPGLSGLHFDRGYVTVTQTGQIFEFDSEEQLPFLLGPLSVFPLEDLETHGESHWGSEVQTTLTKYEQGRSRDPTTSNLFGRPERRVLKTYPAVESIQYSMVADEGERLVVRKTYELRTLDDEGAEPTQRHRGSGTLVFDKKLGMPISLNYRGNYEIRSEEDGLIRVPVNVTYRLKGAVDTQNADEVAKAGPESSIAEKLPQEQATAPADPTPVKKSEPRDWNREELARLLADIKQRPVRSRWSGFGELEAMPFVEALRDEVREVCKTTLDSDELEESKAGTVIEILCEYATEEDIPCLGKVFPLAGRQSFNNASRAIIEVLRKAATPEAINILASRLSDPRDHDEARDALVQIGASVEEAVLEVLQQESFEGDLLAKKRAQFDALYVLGNIGTAKCLEQVKKLESTTSDKKMRLYCKAVVLSVDRRSRKEEAGAKPVSRPRPSRSSPTSSRTRTPGVASASGTSESTEVDGPLTLTLKVKLEPRKIRVSDFGFSPDGKVFVTVTGKTVQAYDPSTGEISWERERPGVPLASRLDFSEDGTRVAVSRLDGVDILDSRTGRSQKVIRSTRSNVQHVEFSPDGKQLAIIFELGKAIEVWDLESEELVSEVLPKGRAWATTFSDDGEKLFAAIESIQGGVYYYKTSTGQYLDKYGSSSCWYVDRAFDGKFIGATFDGLLQFYDVFLDRAGLRVASDEPKGKWKHAKMIPDRGMVAISGGDDECALLFLGSGTKAGSFKETLGRVAVSPDGRLLAFTDDRMSVKIVEFEVTHRARHD